MNSKHNVSLFFLLILLSFSACTKDEKSKEEEPDMPEPEVIVPELEVNYPIYVAEAAQGDCKNTYSYERVDGKVRLKQIDLCQSDSKRYNLKFKYDEQNRLIECKRSVPISDYNYHENIIWNEFLPTDFSIQYATDELTVIDSDNADNKRIYKLGDDGFAKEVSWSSEGKSHVMTLEKLDNDFVNYDLISSTGDLSSKTTYQFKYDERRSIDYLWMILPCLSSKNNILRAEKMLDGKEVSMKAYAYKYHTLNFPVTILMKEIDPDGNEEDLHGKTITLSYVIADHI